MRRDAPVPGPEAPIPTDIPTDTETESSAGPEPSSGDADPTRSEASPSSGPAPARPDVEREFRWVVIGAVGALFVVILAGYIIAGGPPRELSVDSVFQALNARVEPGGTVSTFTQPTDHPVRLPPTSTNLQWEQVAGRWGTLRNRAYVYRPADPSAPGVTLPGMNGSPVTRPAASSTDNLAVVPIGSDGSVEIVLDQVAPGAGLVFRMTDPNNYLAVVVAPDGSGWEFVRVRGGVVETEPIAADPPEDGAYLTVTFSGPSVEVTADSQPVLSTTATGWAGRKVGLIVRGPDGTGPEGAMFDNFLANPSTGALGAGAPAVTAATGPTDSAP